MKALVAAPSHDGAAPAAAYTWGIGYERPGGAVQVALFRAEVPLAAAADVITQSDLALLDRQVRRASFAREAPTG
jgi:hypothetical protein